MARTLVATPRTQISRTALQGYKKRIRVDYTKVSGGSDLTSFPMLVSLTDSDLRTAANGGKVQNASGYDIVFRGANGIMLPHKTKKYVPETGEVVAWVGLPALSASADTDIYMYFGDSAIAASQENKSVWDANYKLCLPFGNGSTLSALDATSNGNSGTINGSVTATTGKIDGAASFPGSATNWVSVPNAATLNFVSGDIVTISTWAKRTSISNYMAIAEHGGGARNYNFGFFDNNKFGLWYTNVGGSGEQQYLSSATYTDTGNSHYYCATYSFATGSSAIIYIDGAPVGASWVSGDGNTAPFATSLLLGIGGNGNAGAGWDWWPGSIEEFRISKGVARTAGWIATEYNNQSSPSTFYSVGALEYARSLVNRSVLA